jgi:hypothetical protein
MKRTVDDDQDNETKRIKLEIEPAVTSKDSEEFRETWMATQVILSREAYSVS